MKKHTFSVSPLVRRAKANKYGEVPIYLRIVVAGDAIELATKHYIPPHLWDSKMGKAKGKTPLSRTVNDTIAILKLKAMQQYNRLVETGTDITPVSIKNGILGVEVRQQPTLLEIFDKMVSNVKSLIGNGYTESTYKNYLASQRQLHKYVLTQYKEKDIRLQELNYGFIDGYEMYLKTLGGCTQNGCIKHMQKLRKAITIAMQYDWLSRDPFARYSIKKRKVTVQPLTRHELTALENKTFPTERLYLIKDLFVFSCFTGLAFCDVASLKKECIRLGIDGEYWIFIARRKTGSLCKIPLLPPAKAILEKYSLHPKVIATGNLLPVPSNQKYNAYLKEIADVVGINKKLTTHIGRHTFATTVALENGIPMEVVKEILGHTDILTTQLYAKVKDKLIADSMRQLREKYAEGHS